MTVVPFRDRSAETVAFERAEGRDRSGHWGVYQAKFRGRDGLQWARHVHTVGIIGTLFLTKLMESCRIAEQRP